MIDVIVTGAAGRMGREVVRAVTAAEGMRVVAAIDPSSPGVAIDDGAGASVLTSSDLDAALAGGGGRVLVDFTVPTAVEATVAHALAAGAHCVVGTTGVTEERWRALAAAAPEGVCLFVAPNFAVGAVLMMRFAQTAARFMPHVEIIELHHDRKLDAPSGTAARTADLMRPAMDADVPIHSVRLPGLVAHQEVIFGGLEETLTIRHDSLGRQSFMPGVLLAVRRVASLTSSPLIGLEHLL